MKRRQLEEGSEGDRHHFPNKLPHFFSTARTLQDHMPRFETIIRKMVKEEVKRSFDFFLRSSSSSSDDDSGSSGGSRPLQLQFHNKLPHVVYTTNRIVSEDGSPLKFSLYDSASRKIVTCGPYCSKKVEMVVLEGDFVGEEDWSKGDFDKKVVHNRQGKRPLITGESIVSLEDGTGCILHDVTFTDNSSWTRSGTFRLGVKLHYDDFEGMRRVREGISNTFRVKDHRGECMCRFFFTLDLYEKHHPPLLDDQVWRLEKIAKDGASHKRLTDFGVSCVRDFLRAYAMDEASLRAVLPKVSNKKWDAIIKHAMTCPLDDNTYIYRTPQGAALVFNSIYNPLRVTFDGLNFHSCSDTCGLDTKMVENLKKDAYKNLNNWEQMQMNDDHSTISLLDDFEVQQGMNVPFGNSFGFSGSSESLYIEQPTWATEGNPMEGHADEEFEEP